MPVWIWNNKSLNTWGPVTESASAPGITVTATATVEKIVYSMGDGGTEVCTTAGTPYKKEYGGKASPTAATATPRPPPVSPTTPSTSRPPPPGPFTGRAAASRAT